MMLLFVPIGIIIDITEKINKILINKPPLIEVVYFYVNFTIYFANILFPIFLFISIIWFTSILASKTEIIAILSSGISFARFLRPYLIGATIVSIVAIFMSFYLVPTASKNYNEFKYKYLYRNSETHKDAYIHKQLNDTQYVYLANLNVMSRTGFDFLLETFDRNNQLTQKLRASSIRYNPEQKIYTLRNVVDRRIGELDDVIKHQEKKDTIFDFELEDLTPVIYMAETLTIGELNKFIEREIQRGSENINTYLVVKYKRYSVPISAFILTIIAVSVSSMKRRGGMGISLAFGVFIAFSYVFFDKIFGTLAEKSDIAPLVAVWLPNIIFGILALYLLNNAKR